MNDHSILPAAGQAARFPDIPLVAGGTLASVPAVVLSEPLRKGVSCKSHLHKTVFGSDVSSRAIFDSLSPANQQVALDSIAKSASALSTATEPTGKVRRYILQAGGRELMPDERIAHCMRTPYGGSVDVVHIPESGTATYRGLQTCKSVWMCAVCGSVISERRRLELKQGIAAWRARGGRVVLLTWTVPHGRYTELGPLLVALKAARRLLRSGRASNLLRGRYGAVVGSARRLLSVRALEVTHGKNGWHPHVHELLFCDPDVDLVELRACLFGLWSAAVAAQGLGKCSPDAFYLEDAGQRVDDYVTKFGRDPSWGPESELSKQVVKTSKAGSTPMDLLVAYCFNQDIDAGRLWQEYARVFFGQRQLEWSPGLRALLGLVAEKTDAELVDEHTQDGYILATLTLDQWRYILANDARAEVLIAASAGDADVFWQYLVLLRVPGAEGRSSPVRVRAISGPGHGDA
ncbi:MAG: protein rep [Chloroflexota bacterium]|nr:protein rep [Chloroflexota bacterium]